MPTQLHSSSKSPSKGERHGRPPPSMPPPSATSATQPAAEMAMPAHFPAETRSAMGGDRFAWEGGYSRRLLEEAHAPGGGSGGLGRLAALRTDFQRNSEEGGQNRL